MNEKNITLDALTTARMGRQTLSLSSTGSTNDFVKAHAHQLVSGAAVYTTRQTAGKGRRGKTWFGDDGQSLALSVLLRGVTPHTQPALPLCCGLSVLEGLTELTGAVFSVKWPNDVLCHEKKISGILCESFSLNGEFAAVLGMGVNLCQTRDELDAAGLPFAGSLLSETERAVEIEDVITAILNRLEPVILACERDGFSAIQARYEAPCINIGRTVRVQYETRERTGVATGIGPDGALLVVCNGETLSVRSGEASVRGLYGYGT